MICPECEGEKTCRLCYGSGEINVREEVAVSYPKGMTTEEFRRFAIDRIDDALGHSWMVRGDNRKLLSALRTRIPLMPDAEIRAIIDAMPD